MGFLERHWDRKDLQGWVAVRRSVIDCEYSLERGDIVTHRAVERDFTFEHFCKKVKGFLSIWGLLL